MKKLIKDLKNNEGGIIINHPNKYYIGMIVIKQNNKIVSRTKNKIPPKTNGKVHIVSIDENKTYNKERIACYDSRNH